MKIKGVGRLVITGGEPLLREDLPEILKAARSYGFQLELITNGILYAERAQKIAGLADKIYFSIDYPVSSEHDRSRGVECFDLVVSAVKKARQTERKPFILCTITRDSIRFLPEMVELSERLKTPVCLNPVYDFYGTQGFEPATIQHIYYYSRRKNVLVNRAAVEFMRDGGNKVLYPRCRAKETTVTLLPDGRVISPCFYNPGGKQGREGICSSCMRWPYMLPSFSVGIDKFRWLDLFSEYSNRIKVDRLIGC